jgi:peptide methionine sulfoxide reductase MsrB
VTLCAPHGRGEARAQVSVDGTHLGHNLPDRRGNRYCINLVSIAGRPAPAPAPAAGGPSAL